MAISKQIIWLGFNLSRSMVEPVCEKKGILKCSKETLESLKDISLKKDIYIYSSQNDLKIVDKLKSNGVRYIQSKDRIQLDPERGDILYVVSIKNYNVFEKQEEEEIPEYAIIEVFRYEAILLDRVA